MLLHEICFKNTKIGLSAVPHRELQARILDLENQGNKISKILPQNENCISNYIYCCEVCILVIFYFSKKNFFKISKLTPPGPAQKTAKNRKSTHFAQAVISTVLLLLSFCHIPMKDNRSAQLRNYSWVY